MSDRPNEQPPLSELPPSDDLPEDEIVYSEYPEDLPEVDELEQSEEMVDEPVAEFSAEDQSTAENSENSNQTPQNDPDSIDNVPDGMGARLERLGGEPAPDISPEEFARLQQSGQIHIDPRGRVRSGRQHQHQDAGVSLRKRRAWYQ